MFRVAILAVLISTVAACSVDENAPAGAPVESVTNSVEPVDVPDGDVSSVEKAPKLAGSGSSEDPTIVEDVCDSSEADDGHSDSDLKENDLDDESEPSIGGGAWGPWEPHPDPRGGGAAGSGSGRGKAASFEHRKKFKADTESGKRVTAGLEWLKDHQNDKGYWSAHDFGADSARKNSKKTHNIEFVGIGDENGDKGWSKITDVGLTGLALLAFTGCGFDHNMGPYINTVRNAILFLRRNQSQEGCFGKQEEDCFVYNHAICTAAMAEVYGLSGQAVIRPTLGKAVDFILRAQNPGFGWRYGIQPGDSDTSVTSWMVLALKCAKMAGIEFESRKAFDDASQWYDLLTIDIDGKAKVGYDSPGSDNTRLKEAKEYETNPTMNAMCIFSKLATRRHETSDRGVQDLAKRCTHEDNLPAWEHHKIDYCYWHFGSLAMFQMGGEHWKRWSKALDCLRDHQRGFHELDVKAGRTTKEALDEHGSWPPLTHGEPLEAASTPRP
ncbi:terpene cyclase/mutase family protein [Planctomycetota bacterium]|nr:terpene cyclase/mutase family protein [Planctomycetota bacterium]